MSEIYLVMLLGSTILRDNRYMANHSCTLRWRHNELDGVSDHQPHDCLLNRLFRRRSKKTSKLRVTGLCVGNSPGTGEFPAQMASNAENISIWWRHHDTWYIQLNQTRYREIFRVYSAKLVQLPYSYICKIYRQVDDLLLMDNALTDLENYAKYLQKQWRI